MSFLTDRKRAEGLGAGGSGAQKHWQMIGTSCAIAILFPLSILVFGHALGGTYEETLAQLARPCSSVVLALTLVVGLIHVKTEIDEAVEDYVGGIKRKLTLIAVSFGIYTLMATGLFALIKLAL